MKKFIALLLAITTLVSLSVVPVYAAESRFDGSDDISKGIVNVAKAVVKAAEEAVKAALGNSNPGNDIKVELHNMSNADGKTFKKVPVKFTDAKPIIVEGRTLIPIRAVAEAVGYDVGWDGEKSEVILECDYAVKGNINPLLPIEYEEQRYNQAASLINTFRELQGGKNIKKTAPGFYKKPTVKGNSEADVYGNSVIGNVIRMGVNNELATSVLFGDNIIRPQTYITAHYKMDVPPLVVNGRTYVPLRAAGELMGLTVTWNNDTRTVVLKADTAK